jgi:hypothetical protein
MLGKLACCKQCLGCGTTRCHSLNNSSLLHACNLRQYSQNQFTNAFSNLKKAVDMDRYAPLQQVSDGRLYIDGIPTKPVNCIDKQRVPRPDVLQQFTKALAKGSNGSTADALILELLIKRATKGRPWDSMD